MNDEQIEELTILCGEATQGPWRIDEDSHPGSANIVTFADGKAVCFMPSDGPYEDGEFIVAAREALPECLKEIEEDLSAKLKQSEERYNVIWTDANEMMAKLAAADEDSARLDWLETEMERDSARSLFRQNRLITRDSIDAARQAEEVK